MYNEHPIFEKPDNENAKIWRYLDFTKFVSMLEKKALFFVRADKLGDQFEGSFSKANLELRPKSTIRHLKERLDNFLKSIRN